MPTVSENQLTIKAIGATAPSNSPQKNPRDPSIASGAVAQADNSSNIAIGIRMRVIASVWRESGQIGKRLACCVQVMAWAGMQVYENILTDRGSKYAVSGGPVTTREDAVAAVKALCRNKKFAKATHNSWAAIVGGVPIKNDDGEAGAGMVILRMMEREGLQDHMIIVTRWFGGTKLGGDRFRRVQDAVRYYLERR